MPIRIGDLLVERGSITREQRDEILVHQFRRARPFGVLAEELFGVSKQDVETAWSAQYASMADRIDPANERIDPVALASVTRRQAWQFGLLPMRVEGGELVVATTADRLPRALRFTSWRVAMPCRFDLCAEHRLAEALECHLPMAGLDARFLNDARPAAVDSLASG